ncbi:PepSY domain-containing protein [Azoarcus sp. TTM-91]|uniref:PepSY domain-containing protein n=1 Tax=Azoarcus sp. TTM-91 TaxID=2691581 RepID=UPI00145D0A7B|nr:PepSY domain-containing protein [Azoarcus sp. TTM-91]NMG35705.1 PepSY domain-containing protein [Azoarcus sp. TTM-91]
MTEHRSFCFWPRLRRWLYLVHRWLGVGGCLLFVLWFITGLVMMYVRFPALSEAERLAGLPPLQLEGALLGPDEAWRAAGLPAFPVARLRLEMLATADGGAEPVWRTADAGWPITLSARDGRIIQAVDVARATAIARRFADGAEVRYLETRERDQWTLPNANAFEALRPLHRYAVADGAGTELYISAVNGEVVRDTDRHERGWTWLGTIPHYYTFAVLREQHTAWRQTVLWTSGLGMAAALSGIAIGLLRLRLRRRYRNGAVTPHRGWMAWHHLAGLAGGLFVFTWVASGWVSMNPGGWLARKAFPPAALQAYVGERGEFPWSADLLLRLQRAAGGGLREIEAWWFDGQPMLLLADGAGRRYSMAAVEGAAPAPSEEAIATAARRLLPGAGIARLRQLTEEDRYWYGRRQPVVLPVWRVEMDDAAATWLHIDPANGRLLASSDSDARLRRWLFNAAHSFDFPCLLTHRPAWNGVMWLLSALGLVVSASGAVAGWRHLRRRAARR